MEANDASLGSGDATTRAQELRASLGARQDVETMLADASRVRQEAAVAADALVAEAQQLSTQLVAESQDLATQVTTEARERADAILARARVEAEEVADRARATADAIRAKAETDVEEHRRRVRAEVSAQVTRDLTEQHRREVAAEREQSDKLISDLEASVRILGVSLDSALANVSELLGAVEGLRPTTEAAAQSRVTEPVAEPVVESGPTYDVGNPAPASTVPTPTSEFGAEPEREPEPVRETREGPGHLIDHLMDNPVDRPRTATEAFLTSSSLEMEQSDRELRELQQSEDVRRRRTDESRRAAQRRELDEGLPDEGLPDEDQAEAAESARPLGWLFRTAQ